MENQTRNNENRTKTGNEYTTGFRDGEQAGAQSVRIENIQSLQSEIRHEIKNLATKEDTGNILQKLEKVRSEIPELVNTLLTKEDPDSLLSKVSSRIGEKIESNAKDSKIWLLKGYAGFWTGVISSIVAAGIIMLFVNVYDNMNAVNREPSQMSTEESRSPSVADDESSTTGNNSSNQESHIDTESESNTN